MGHVGEEMVGAMSDVWFYVRQLMVANRKEDVFRTVGFFVYGAWVGQTEAPKTATDRSQSR